MTQEQIGTPTGMLGIPEFGTNFVRGMVDETHRRPLPSSYSYLASHGTDVWLGNAQDLISKGLLTCPPLSAVGTTSWFTSCTRAWILRWPLRSWSACEGPLAEDFEEERNGYIAAHEGKQCARVVHRVLWKIKYMFPRPMATIYVILALRVAYFKVHHPIYYYCAYFSIRAKAFDIKTMSGGLDAVKPNERISENARTTKLQCRN